MTQNEIAIFILGFFLGSMLLGVMGYVFGCVRMQNKWIKALAKDIIRLQDELQKEPKDGE